MDFSVPGFEAFAASLSHCASRDMGATTRVVQGAGSMDEEFLGSLGRLLTDESPEAAAFIETSDLCECIRLSISMVLPRPISAIISKSSDY